MKYYREYSYPSAQKLYKILKDDGFKVTLATVENTIKAMKVYQLHKKQKKKFRSHIIAFAINQIWQVDLIDMQKYAKVNRGYKYILLVIDVFSRKAYAIPLKTKSSSDVLDAFEQLFNDESIGIPNKIISDNGSEFIDKYVQQLFNDEQIIHDTVLVGDHNSLGIVDRLCRTIKEKMEKYFSDYDTATWIDKLPDIMKSYNKTPHTSLKGLSPNKVKDNIDFVVQLNRNKIKKPVKISNNQMVRIKLKKAVFDKGYKQIWSNNIYKLKDIRGLNGILDDGTIVRLNDLQFVQDVKDNQPNVKQKKVEKEYKVEKKVKEEGLEEQNITRTLRPRVPKHKVIDDEFGAINF